MPERRKSLTPADWRVLIGVAVAQVITSVALRTMSLSAIRTRAARTRRLAQFLVRDSEERIVWAIGATGRRLGPISTCLVRALVAELFLGSPERPLYLAIGVKRTTSGALEAHAWVGRDGRVLVGETPDAYVPLVGWTTLSA